MKQITKEAEPAKPGEKSAPELTIEESVDPLTHLLEVPLFSEPLRNLIFRMALGEAVASEKFLDFRFEI